MSESNATNRFTNRAPFYHPYRPRYPGAVLETLAREAGLSPQAVIADIGSGTGISCELFLKNGNPVYGVEPNAAMRGEAERHLAAFPNFHSVNGSAEATGLADHSVAFVTVGQAAHWFDVEAARAEFRRILKPDGQVILFWNSRGSDSSPFAQAVGELVQSVRLDEQQRPGESRREKIEELAEKYFGADGYTERTFPNPQSQDFESLRGGVLSASYSPLPGHPNHERLMTGLKTLFDQYQVDGTVRSELVTHVFWGRV
jgi:SAM-dependent methyltransferase